MPTVYADNAATTPMSETAIRAVESAMRTLWGNPSSLHAAGQDAKAALEHARRRVAACLGAAPSGSDRIIFTSGGSEADNQAIRSAAMAGARMGRRHILSTPIEHHAVLHTLTALEAEGFTVEMLPVSREGRVDPADVAQAIRPDTALVTVMYANNEIGTCQPIRAIGRLCRARGVLFHTDAVQAVGHIPVDVTADCIDYLSLSAHKFHGPKGIGALYVRAGAPVSPLIYGGAQEGGMRAGTENLPAVLGMTAALCEAVEHLTDAPHIAALRDRLAGGLLTAIPGCVRNGTSDPTGCLPGIVSLCIAGVESEALLLRADLCGIALSAGAACASGALEPSHVLRAIGCPESLAVGAVRLSLSAQNTEADVDYILGKLPGIVADLRRDSTAGRETVPQTESGGI